jgi:hypothetical protein
MPGHNDNRELTAMEMPKALKSAGLALVTAVILCGSLLREGRAQTEAPALAVAGIDYVDTSGEVIDQSADHARRLRAFEAALRSDLSAGGKLRSVSLDCPPDACSVSDIDAKQLIGKAQAAGADFLLISSFHKVSTLVQWAKFDMIDVKAQKLSFERLVSFRGDNDEAWRRAEAFIVRDIRDRELTRPAAAALPRSP